MRRVLLFLVAACGAAPSPARVAASPQRGVLGVVAEGTCPKLAAAEVGGRAVLVYGDDGYVPRDWQAGEALGARQSLALVKDDGIFFDPSLTRGLPSKDGWVAGDLTAGGSWLVRATTRYAGRAKGALFDREERSYGWNGKGWQAAARGAEPPPSSIACARHPEAPTFVRLASAGDRFFAGRCRDDAPVNRRDAILVFAVREGTTWKTFEAPGVQKLDAVIDASVVAVEDDDVYLAAYEPFVATDQRKAYLAHFDGSGLSVVSTPAMSGIASIAMHDGKLYVASGRDLFERSGVGAWKSVPLPALAFTEPGRPDSLRVTGVRSAGGALWIETAFLVKQNGDEVRASAIFRDPAPRAPVFCDASKPAREALAVVE